MDYMSTKEAAQKWGISERRVRSLCATGKIEGASRCGDWVWSIPKGTQKPADGRTLRYMKNRSLKTGFQDYAKADFLRSSLVSTSLNSHQKAQIIYDAMNFDGIDITADQIEDIFNLVNQKDVALKTQVLALNANSVLSSIPFDFNEKKLLDIHKRLMSSVNEKSAGRYSLGGSQSQETEAMLEQYVGPWSVLHPVARAAFLFSEILRIAPFDECNTLIAFILLENELCKTKLPPALFGSDKCAALKAALVSSRSRGNSQTLVSMILDAVSSVYVK